MSSGEVLDGTSVNGIEVGGQTRGQATELIGELGSQQVELTEGQRTVTVRAPQAGLVIDAEKSADRAYSAGRSGIGSILKGPLVIFGGRELEPEYNPVDSKRLARTVDRIADKLDRQPFVGALSVDRETLEVTFDQPKAGVGVRRGAAREGLLNAFQDGRRSMDLPVRQQPAPSPAEVQTVADQAERYLRRPLRVRTAGGNASFAPRQLAGVLTIESAGGKPGAGIQLGADPGKVKPLVAGLAARRDRQSRDAGINTPPLPPVNLSEQGDLSWRPKPDVATVRLARTGRQIRQDEAVASMIKAVRDGDHQVRFPTELVEPEVTTAAVKRGRSLLGTFTTSFGCCEPRVRNIQRMTKTVDGTVIGPGEQFSLNAVAGERTRANGYVPAPTIGEGNKLIDTVGGGVSQFSTTAYNAAYFAGLQIDTHTPHSFYIDRYPAGRESTLNFGSIDLLWTNDTKAPVVVRSSASDTAVTVSIYGGNGGRRVRAETRSRSDNSEGGFDITIDRVVTGSNGTRKRDSFATSYGLPSE
ncbi:MAG: VanW family protein [Solirubrobacterales bacterium]|nr:VanW family protein [Solirubrobacterales bacterium]